MISLIVSILLSLNIISTSAEYEQMSVEEQEYFQIIITDTEL